MEAIYISREGYNKLYDSYLAIDKKIAETLKKMGESAERESDLMENIEYMQLRNKAVCVLPRQKKELKARYDNAIIIEDTEEYSNFDGSTVIRCSEVTLNFDGEEETYRILGNHEDDLDNNIISCDSPLAQLILGKKIGESGVLNGANIIILAVKRV